MGYITVKLTEYQAEQTIQALEWALDGENPGQGPHNRFLQRIIDKIRKEMQTL